MPDDALRVSRRFRVLHAENLRAACLWFAVDDSAGRLWCYREWAPKEAVGAAEFALGVLDRTPRDETIGASWTDAADWRDGGEAKMWRAAGLYCRTVRVAGDPAWSRLREFLRPVEVRGRTGEWEIGPRMRFSEECAEAERAATMAPDSLMGRVLLIACLSMPSRFCALDERDRERGREDAEDRWFAREFPNAAAARRTRMGY